MDFLWGILKNDNAIRQLIETVPVCNAADHTNYLSTSQVELSLSEIAAGRLFIAMNGGVFEVPHTDNLEKRGKFLGAKDICCLQYNSDDITNSNAIGGPLQTAAVPRTSS